MACFSEQMTKLFDIKWIREKTIIRVNRFLTSTRDGLLIVHIYNLDVIETVSTRIIGSPRNIGIYFEKCIVCKTFWRSVKPFKRCSKCENVICNHCFRTSSEIAACAMCNKICCFQCKQFEYRKCSWCYNIHRKSTQYCENCWEIITERKDYICDGCDGHPRRG